MLMLVYHTHKFVYTIHTQRAKGNPVPIPEPGSGTVNKSCPRKRVRRGNPKRPGDAVGRSGKSFLFCMSVRVPWNPLAGRYGLEREEHRSCGGVRIFPSDLENPGEGHVEYPAGSYPYPQQVSKVNSL